MKKESSKKFGKQKILFICLVFIIAGVILTVSYNMFFSINLISSSYAIEDITVSFDGDDYIKGTDLEVLSDEFGVLSYAQISVYTQNSSINDYKLTFVLEENSDNLMLEKYIKLAIFEYDTVSKESAMISDIITLSNVLINEDGQYVLLSDEILDSTSGSNTKTYTIKFWLDESISAAASTLYTDFSVKINAESLNDLINYSISGYLTDSNGDVMKNATISLNNATCLATTNEYGYYSLNDVYPDTYLVSITSESGALFQTKINLSTSDFVSVNYSSGVYELIASSYSNINNLNISLGVIGVSSMEVS